MSQRTYGAYEPGQRRTAILDEERDVCAPAPITKHWRGLSETRGGSHDGFTGRKIDGRRVCQGEGGLRRLTQEQRDSEWNVAEYGKMLVDRYGEKIGKLQDVYVDVETDEPQFGDRQGGVHRPPFDVRAAGCHQGRSR